MDDRSGKLKKTRVSVTMTKPYLDALEGDLSRIGEEALRKYLDEIEGIKR